MAASIFAGTAALFFVLYAVLTGDMYVVVPVGVAGTIAAALTSAGVARLMAWTVRAPKGRLGGVALGAVMGVLVTVLSIATWALFEVAGVGLYDIIGEDGGLHRLYSQVAEGGLTILSRLVQDVGFATLFGIAMLFPALFSGAVAGVVYGQLVREAEDQNVHAPSRPTHFIRLD